MVSSTTLSSRTCVSDAYAYSNAGYPCLVTKVVLSLNGAVRKSPPFLTATECYSAPCDNSAAKSHCTTRQEVYAGMMNI
jgi:hypothetical protein